MSMEIDNRIVNMIFNNQQFEEGVSETTESLDKLKKSLDFDSVKDAAKGVDLSYIADSIEGLTNKFSAFKQFGAKIIQEFASDVYRTTKNLVNDAVVKPIRDGFDEYQLKMGSVQTILNSAVNKSGAKVSLEEVNYQLEELNKYADKTIYSFRDMTSNIGKFTNAGVALEDAVAAIQGVSNVAALSGANANEASRAMYNFAQALSAGYVKLIDWKSIENANMATVEFKQQLIDTAVALGTLEKRADGTYKVLTGGGFFEGKGKEKIEKYISATQNFNDSLSKAWMTSEVLTTTLAKYSDETTDLGRRAFAAATEVKTLSQAWDTLREAAGSSWAQTFEIIFGDFNEGKALWTRLEQDLETIFVKGSERRNEFIQSWVDLGGRGSLFDTTEENLGALWNLLDVVKILINTVKTAFTDVFGTPSAQMLSNLTKKFQRFTEKLTTNIRLFRTIGSIFRGFFSAIALVGDAFKAAIKPIGDFFDRAIPRKNVFIEEIGSIGDAITNFRKNLIENGFFEEISDRFSKIYKALGRFAYGIVGNIKDLISLFTKSRTVLDSFGSHNILLTSKVAQAFNSLRNIVKSVATTIAEVIASAFGLDRIAVVKKVSDTFTKIENKIYDVYTKIKNSDIASKIGEFWNSLKGPDSGSKEQILGFFESVKKWFAEIAEKTQFLEHLKKLFTSIFGFLKNAVKSISPIILEFGKFTLHLIDKLVDILGDLFKTMAAGFKNGTLADYFGGGLNLGIGYGIFKSISSIGDLLDAISTAFGENGSVYTMLKEIAETLNAFQRWLNAKALRNVAVSIAVLAASLLLLSGIDSIKMAESSVAIALLMKSLVAFTKTLSVVKKGSLGKSGFILIEISAAVLTVATALRTLGQMETKDLIKGFSVIVLLLTSLSHVTKTLGGSKLKSFLKLNSAATIIKSFASSVTVLAVAMKLIGSMDGAAIARSLLSITLLMTELTAFSSHIGANTKKITSAGTSILALSVAIGIVSLAMRSLGNMDSDQMIVGLEGITAIVIALSFVAQALSKIDSKKVAVGSASMIMLSSALVEVSIAFKILSTISFEGMVVAFILFAEAIIGVVGALEILSRVDPQKLILAASAMSSVGLALLEVSIGLKILGSMSLAQMGVGLLGLVVALGLFVGAAVLLNPILPKMKELAGVFMLFSAASAIFAVALTLVSVSLATIGGSLVVVVASMIEAFKILLLALPELATALADSLSKAFESIVNIVVTILMALIEAVRQSIPSAIEALFEVIDKLLAAIVDYAPTIIESLIKIIVGLVEGIGKGVPDIIKAFVDMLKSILSSIKEVLGDMGAIDVLEAMGMVALLSVLMAEIAVLVAVGLVATLGLPEIGKNLSSFMTNIQPFIDGIKSVGSETLDGAKALADAILALTVSSILDGITRWITGKSSFESFGKELAAFGPHLKTYNDSIKGISNTNITASADAIKTMAEMANELPNSGGIVSWFKGDNTLADFGEMLASFGPYFATYAQSVNGINPTAITASANAAKTLVEMANEIPNSGGLISLISGDNTLSKFGAMLAAFGPYLKTYSDSVNGLNTAAITSSVGGTNNLIKVANAVATINLSSDTGAISNFGTQVTKLGSGVYAYASFMATINWNLFARSVTEINKLADLSDRLEMLDTSTLSTFANNMSKMASNGIRMLNQVFTNSYMSVYNKAIEVANRAVMGVNSVTPQLATAGANMMQGFINGLNGRAQAVYNTAQAIANQAAAIVRRSLQIHSPSKVFEEIGMYVDLGFAQGLTKYADTIESSADTIGRSAMDSMAGSIQNAIDNIDDNPDFSPTITPILDLTNVNDGLNRLGETMNSDRLNAMGTYRTSMDLAGMVLETNRNNQNGGIMLDTMLRMMDEFSNLSSAVENMQIVMDSGVVVGAIAPKMDAALGRRVVYKGRGN